MTRKDDQIKIVARELEAKAIELNVLNKPQSDKGRTQLEFGIGKMLLVNFLIGRKLYSKDTIVVGELIQNAVDACHMRKSIDPSYTPEIYVYRSKDKLVIEDNGVGTMAEILKVFLSKTKSLFPPLEMDEQGVFTGKVKRETIGSLGIGILSCLSIATKISIESKRRNVPAWRVVIENSPEKWRYEKGSMSDQGTRVVLWLDEDGKRKDMSRSIREFAKTYDIPILVIEETPKMKPKKKTEMLTNYVYAIWLKIDETLPWIEFKGTYMTIEEAKKAEENLRKNMKTRIVSMPKGRFVDKSKIAEIFARTREFSENT